MPKLNDILNRKESVDETTLEVDLVEMFGEDVPDSSGFRQAVGQAIIDRIRERTENGEFQNRAKQTYSDEYADSIDFKAYGKSKSDVNLTQTGDMLGLLDIVEERRDKIVLGWSDSVQNAKAFNHITGDTVPRRDFFGLPKSDLDEIANSFRDELPKPDPEFTDTTILTSEFLRSGTNTGARALSAVLSSILGEDDEF